MGVKGTDKILAPDVYVSAGEVTLGDSKIQAVFDKLGLEYVLHNLWGFDKTVVFESTGTFYEIDECKHRSRQGKIVDGKRYVGRERLDDSWIEQGNPSENARIASRQDMSYIRELQSLGKQMKSL